ncbi:MAG: bifunctional phosphoribosyl-AMP cyclohydrolase/phosphoribosyl-ATP diphosphatase HisIE [Nitrospirota bacterium]
MAKKSEIDNLWSAVRFDTAGLIPAVVQERGSGRVLMLAYMNRESLERTLKSGFTHFFSRSRQTLWKKGETSGHTQRVANVWLDCDGDTLVVEVDQVGPACHTGSPTCFFRRVDGERLIPDQEGGGAVLDRVYRVIQDRKAHPVEGSYVASLFAGGEDRILKKVAEEAGEVLLASKNGVRDQIVWETADLWFHTLVALGRHDIPPSAIYDELARRFTNRAPASRKRTATKPTRKRRRAAR